MKIIHISVLALLTIVTSLPALAQPKADAADPSQALEARLNQVLHASDEGGRILKQLIEFYHKEGRVFGLVRSGQSFIKSHPDHPEHAELMLQLLDGVRAASMMDDIISTARQFSERHPKHPKANEVRWILARTLAHEGRKQAEAASVYAKLWNSNHPRRKDAAWRAIEIYTKLGGAKNLELAGQLASDVVNKEPANSFATLAGLAGFNAYRRYSDWAGSVQIGLKMMQKKVPMRAEEEKSFLYHMAESYRSLKQYNNALKIYRTSQQRHPNPDTQYKIVQTAYDAGLKGNDVEREANLYIQQYAKDDPTWAWGLVALTYDRDKNPAKAVEFAQRCLPVHTYHHDVGGKFVGWLGAEEKNYPRIEQALKAAIAKNTNDPWRLRYHLGFSLYRDRMKDNAKAKVALRELLEKSPVNDSHARTAMHWLLDAAQDDAEFKQELDRVVRVIRNNPHHTSLSGYLREWHKGRQSKKEIRSRIHQASTALKSLQDDAGLKTWKQALDRRKGFDARIALLKQNLTKEQKDRLLRETISMHWDTNKSEQRIKALPLLVERGKLNPTDYSIAYTRLEAATSYGGNDAEVRSAIENMLKFTPEKVDMPSVVRMLRGARQLKDAALARRAMQWNEATQKKHGPTLYYLREVIGELNQLDLKTEAIAYARARVDLEPDRHESRTAMETILATVEDPTEKQKLIAAAMQKPSDQHGAYASWMADLQFKAGDLAGFARTLEDAIKRQEARRPRPWSMGEYPAQGWIDAMRGNKEASNADRLRVYDLVERCEIYRTSGIARCARLELASAQRQPIMQRLVTSHDAMLNADRSTTAWDRFNSYAQASLTREAWSLAAAQLTGMLHVIKQVDGGRADSARKRITRAYSKLGSLGMDVAADSPIAPLLEIGLFLRLGDREKAVASYLQRENLFNKHKNELPLELVLFAAETQMIAGGDENFQKAEDILRAWTIEHGEKEEVSPNDKARVGLMLGRVYFKSGRFDVARNEFNTVKNRFADTEEAIEAEFGIGESYMAQKVFDKAEEIFTDLARNRENRVAIRAEFLRGVLANRRGDLDEARDIFRTVLERVPDIELANETLYNLAEVYGIEQRYMDQLDLLRTVGRLGRESKRWHVPGDALSIVVQDSDLGISRGHTRIPVMVSTKPGGDREKAYLVSGGAGKGLFMTEIDTSLGEAMMEDDLLQLKGNDTIHVDYPNEFKKQFKFQLLADSEIQIASDAQFEAASQAIDEEEKETITDTLKMEGNTAMALLMRSNQRPTNQIKPGNLIYLQVIDPDRDQTADIDRVPVKLTATSGDEVQTELVETGPHSGIFEGSIKTGELPAGALASDSSIDHNPLMAIDHDETTTWQSEPDGAAPKWLSIDLKDIYMVDEVVLHTPDPSNQAPVRAELLGSSDGRFWFPLAEHPVPAAAEPIELPYTDMTRKVFKLKYPLDWEKIRKFAATEEPLSDETTTEMSWVLPKDAEGAKSGHAILWHGKFVQRRTGCVRLAANGNHTAIMVDGVLHRPPTTGSQTVDLLLEPGLHDLSVFVWQRDPTKPCDVKLARENVNVEQVNLGPFRDSDLDLSAPDIAELRSEIRKNSVPETSLESGSMRFKFNPEKLRHVKVKINEYLGEAVAINHVEVGAGDNRIIPTQADVLALAVNDELELTAGDMATVNYIDEITAGGLQRNRLLSRKLTATYYNADIDPISYQFLRGGDGGVTSIRKSLMRIDPGERIGIEVTDYDMDQTEKEDTLQVEVVLNDQVLTVDAVETEPNSGIFRTEVDTRGAGDTNTNATATTETGSAGEEKETKAGAPVLTVKRGDVVLLKYTDAQNTFPGHSVERTAEVFVNQPSEARIRVVETRIESTAEGKVTKPIFLPPSDTTNAVGVAFEVPFTVEVIDPDAAKDNLSQIQVALSVDGAPRQVIHCSISEAHGQPTTAPPGMSNWALYEGRFVGQIIMQLGGEDSPNQIPYTDGMTRNMSVASYLTGKANDAGGVDMLMPVLNLTGKDTVAAAYNDALHPDGTNRLVKSTGRLRTNGRLMISDAEYEDPLEMVHVGEKLFLRVDDPDRDGSDERDRIEVTITTDSGEKETVQLEETLGHSGVFTGSFPLKDQEKPSPGNLGANPEIECFFGNQLTATYSDPMSASAGDLVSTSRVPVAIGTDGEVAAFSKLFGDKDLAVETQFHIAESYFELFKGHLKLEREEEANKELAAGRRILTDLRQDYPDPKYLPRINYLLGQFAQELEDWDTAIDAYETIVRNFAEHSLAADAQYKLAQCYEKAGEFDEALEAYVTLASTYPKSPLIASVMIRISEYFYRDENYLVAAQVGKKFIERFQDHEFAARMAFRVGQSYYKQGQAADPDGTGSGKKFYVQAAEAFDVFVKTFPDDKLCSEALFWAGESYHSAKNIPLAFRRYNRCRWDFPETDAAKYARGRLALPELLAQFEKEANLEE